MNFVIFDLEFNQANNSKPEKKCPFEIIQIGAITLDSSLQEIDSFNRLVKPMIYNNINSFVSTLTGLTIEKLEYEDPFINVYKDFLDYINKGTVIFCTWGMSDMKELFRNANYYRLSTSILPKNYINVQPYVTRYLNFPKNISVSLRDAMNFLDIKHQDNFHNAFYDALYTTMIFQKLYGPDMVTQVYQPYKIRNHTKKQKQHVDTIKLIYQFEKMFNRDMSQEEISMIKLAYLMGKTGQFLK
ncbi:exonuclease [Alkalibaculum sp. M08DMB]|uniref:Exonuclease n=1 Tax=Alkalibaculum sporogenes TaxID=2655001 RepID=A0A6A7K5E5_9FIRM|nr:3'-5' exonuclease [Alkalibaculum sporogenes]MPW24487.1 exonuclease [Alkalibaculum sporogenes]